MWVGANILAREIEGLCVITKIRAEFERLREEEFLGDVAPIQNRPAEAR
jgi:hypothetical protein